MTSIYVRFTGSFSGLPRSVWLLGAVVLLNTSGRMVTTFMAVYLAMVLHLSEHWIGGIIVAYGIGTVIGALVGGFLCNRLPPDFTMAASLAGMGVGYIVLWGVSSPQFFLPVIFLCACCEGAMRPPLVLMLMQSVAPVDRIRCHAVYCTALNLGYAIGAAGGGLLSTMDFSLIFWVDGATSLLAAWALVSLVPLATASPHMAEAPPSSQGQAIWKSWNWSFVILCAVAFAIYAVGHQRLATYPLYLTRDYGLDPAALGVVLMVQGALAAGSGIFLADWVKHLDQRLVASIGALLTGASFALLPVGESMAFALLLGVLLAIGDVLFAPAMVALVYLHVSGRQAGRLLGVYYAAISLCRSVGPAAGLWAFAIVGSTLTWFACGVLGLASCLVLFGLLERK